MDAEMLWILKVFLFLGPTGNCAGMNLEDRACFMLRKALIQHEVLDSF
jgi:hypothetical protein